MARRCRGVLDAYKKRPQKALRRDEWKEGTEARLGPAVRRSWLIMFFFLREENHLMTFLPIGESRECWKEGTEARLGPAVGRPWLIMIILF